MTAATTVTQVERLEVELEGAETELAALVESATPKNRNARHATADRIDELKADRRRAVTRATEAEQAVLDVKRAADVRVAEGTAQEIRKVIEPAAEALETLAEQVRQLRPLLRKLTGQLQPLGRRLPNRCLSGQQIQWTIVGTLNDAWPGLVEPSLPHGLRGFEFGDLTLRDIDRTMRGLTTTEEGTP